MEFDPDTLRFRLLDHSGAPVPAGRSTGERAVLALSVVHGLQRASGRRLPLVIEAPLKPLDPEHTRRVVTNVFADHDGQTILLVKPGEVQPPLMEKLEFRVGQRFELVRPDSAVERSDVRRVGEVAID